MDLLPLPPGSLAFRVPERPQVQLEMLRLPQTPTDAADPGAPGTGSKEREMLEQDYSASSMLQLLWVPPHHHVCPCRAYPYAWQSALLSLAARTELGTAPLCLAHLGAPGALLRLKDLRAVMSMGTCQVEFQCQHQPGKVTMDGHMQYVQYCGTGASKVSTVLGTHRFSQHDPCSAK